MIDLAAYKAHQKRTQKASNQIRNVTAGDSISLFGDVSDRGHTVEENVDHDNGEDPPELQHRSRLLKSSNDISSRTYARPQTLYSQCGYMHEDDTPTDEQLMLCSSHVWGYSFREKDWGECIYRSPWHNSDTGPAGLYAVDKLYKVEFKKNSFDKLVMNKHYKDIVRAMVANHVEEDANQFRDLVDGKGQGVVILLHGISVFLTIFHNADKSD